MNRKTALSLLILSGLLSAAPAPVEESSPRLEARASPPTVKLDAATFTGYKDILTGTNKFLNIPFAKPPTGNRRFRLPEPIDPYTTNRTVTAFGPSCPQQAPRLPIPGIIGDVADDVLEVAFSAIFPDSEDCLSLNVVVPPGATPSSKLPVLVWFFGGAFQLGSPSMYDGGNIVNRAADLGTPIIYVSINYRVSAWGFLGGKEVKAAGVGNLGLQDQRQGLRWIQKYISAFGGDPTKVTIWGESAGAISSALHMVTNGGNTEGLFRGAFMQSGAAIPVGDITKTQYAYDEIVNAVGCKGAADTLQCLREVPYSTLKSVVNDTPGIFDYSSLRLTWAPRVDGVFLKEPPFDSVHAGRVATVPYVSGTLDDEGTLFTLSTLNVTTDAEFRTWIKTYFLPLATDAELDKVMEYYPSDLSAGSPYDTGILNALTPQSKRIASFQGDLAFQGPRRMFLINTAHKQNVWTYLDKEGKGVPFLGSFHGSDILNSYGVGELRDYLIRFTVNLDPNVGTAVPGLINWPKWNLNTEQSLVLKDGVLGLFDLEVGRDDFRRWEIGYLIQMGRKYPL